LQPRGGKLMAVSIHRRVLPLYIVRPDWEHAWPRSFLCIVFLSFLPMRLVILQHLSTTFATVPTSRASNAIRATQFSSFPFQARLFLFPRSFGTRVSHPLPRRLKGPTSAPRLTGNNRGRELPLVRYCSHRRNMHRKDDPSSAMDISKGREVLPTNVKPLHYDLTLEPNFETFKYSGKVTIEYVWQKIP